MKISVRDVGTSRVVEVDGDVDLATSPELRRTLFEALPAVGKLALNLAAIRYIDSSGIGELVSGYTAVKNQSGDLKLLHLTKKVRDLLQITKLYTVFDVFTDESTALRSFT